MNLKAKIEQASTTLEAYRAADFPNDMIVRIAQMVQHSSVINADVHEQLVWLLVEIEAFEAQVAAEENASPNCQPDDYRHPLSNGCL